MMEVQNSILTEGTGRMLSTFAQYQFYARDPVKSAQRIAAEPAVKRDAAYYQANIGKVKSVDDFIGNYRLFSYAMKSYGLEDSIQNRGMMKKVLTSDLTDSKSFANKLTDSRYKTFAAAFSFATNGKVVSTAAAQDATQESDTLGLYSNQTLVGTTQAADVTYYKAHIGEVTSVDGLMANSRLYRIALQAYGIDPATTSTDTIRHVLESDTYDPKSFVNTSGHSGDAVQSASDTRSTIAAYTAAAGSDAASQAAATVETAYYRSAIPAVTSVDAFLSDDRLVSYAAKAFGLSDTNAAALKLAKANGADVTNPLTAAQTSDILRAALTSDLSNPASVANTLGGAFLAAAQAFNFGPTAIQSPAGTADTTARYAQGTASDAASQTAAAAETAYYAATITKVKTADQFAADPRLVAYATQAYGLTFDPSATTAQKTATIQAALASDPTDPQGAAAKAGTAFVIFAASFNAAPVTYAQSASAAESTVDLYGQGADQSDPTATATETEYFLDTMPGVKTADALVGDSRLAAYVTTAYGITFPANATDAQKQAQLKTILTSTPDNAGAQFGDGARRLAAAFQFDAKGVAQQGQNAVSAAGFGVQSPSTLQASVDLYTERLGTDPSKQAQGTVETAYYKAAIAKAGSIDDIVNDKRVVAYAAAAYGVSFPDDATDDQKSTLMRGILTSDVDDPKSVASQNGDQARMLASAFAFNATYAGDDAITRNGQDAYVKLAQAFNFDGDGHVTDPRLAQSARDTQSTLSLYKKNAGTATSTEIQADTTYYGASIGQVKTLDGFLSDPRLVSVATAAYGVTRDPKLSDAQWTAQLKAVLTSDVSDPKSVASKLGPAFRAMAAAFTLASNGTVTRDPAQLAQSKKAAVLTVDPYVQQVMQDEAGQQSTGAQLALYFRQKAPTLTNAYQILADKSLLTVMQTALNLPTSMSKLDIDAQARMITTKLKLSDLQDPKKLASFIQRYTIRYDVNAAASTSPTSVLGLDASGTTVSSSSLLSLINPAAQAVDTTSSMPILQLFKQS